jgi:hypothetical protein
MSTFLRLWYYMEYTTMTLPVISNPYRWQGWHEKPNPKTRPGFLSKNPGRYFSEKPNRKTQGINMIFLTIYKGILSLISFRF